MIDTATTLSTGHINVGGFFKVTAGQASPVVTHYEKVMADAKKAVPEMAFAVHRGRGWAKVVSDTGAMQLGITGIDIKSEPAFASVLRIASGKLEDLAQPGTILIFDTQAEKLGVKVGDALTISAPTTRGTNNTIDVRIVAIAHGLGLLSSWNCFVPIQSLRALYQLNQDATGVSPDHAGPKGSGPHPGDAGRLRQALETGGLPGDGGRPARVLDEVPVGHARGVDRAEAGRHQLGRRDLVHDLDAEGAAGAVLRADRHPDRDHHHRHHEHHVDRDPRATREVGTLRAIGMHRREVLWMFLLESLMLGLFASTVGGVLAAAAIAAGLNAAHIPVPSGCSSS
jgi:hypothetical protein